MKLPPTRSARTLFLLPAAGLLAGIFLSFLVPQRYVSTAVMVFEEVAGGENAARLHHNVVDFFIQCQSEAMSRTSLSELIQNPDLNLYSEARQTLPIEDVIEGLRREIEVKIVDRPGFPRDRMTVFQIAFPAPDRRKAQLAAQHLITRFIDAAQKRARADEFREVPPAARTRMNQLETRVAELEKRLGIAAPPVLLPEGVPITAEVIEPASLPDWPVSPNRYLFAGIGCGAGFLAMFGLMLQAAGGIPAAGPRLPRPAADSAGSSPTCGTSAGS